MEATWLSRTTIETNASYPFCTHRQEIDKRRTVVVELSPAANAEQVKIDIYFCIIE
jgi:hypothetical protein